MSAYAKTPALSPATAAPSQFQTLWFLLSELLTDCFLFTGVFALGRLLFPSHAIIAAVAFVCALALAKNQDGWFPQNLQRRQSISYVILFPFDFVEFSLCTILVSAQFGKLHLRSILDWCFLGLVFAATRAAEDKKFVKRVGEEP